MKKTARGGGSKLAQKKVTPVKIIKKVRIREQGATRTTEGGD